MGDRYTKAVLTVIAACLVIMVVRDIPVVARGLADSGLYQGQSVSLTAVDRRLWPGWSEALPVNVVGPEELRVKITE